MTNTARGIETPRYTVGQEIVHAAFGRGRVLAVIPAENPGEVCEYEVKLKHDRYPAMLTHDRTMAASDCDAVDPALCPFCLEVMGACEH